MTGPITAVSLAIILGTSLCAVRVAGQETSGTVKAALQPLAQQVRQSEQALSFLGQALTPSDTKRINSAIGDPDEAKAVARLESTLDPVRFGDRDNQCREPRKSRAGTDETRTGRAGRAGFPGEGPARSGSDGAFESRERKQRANYELPAFDGIGANEYIVDVTYPNTVDFISTMDTPSIGELDIWYHTLNVGFRTRISGETDFPCITDSRVCQGRVYAKVDGGLSYAKWLEAVRTGRSYVSDGRSHLMDSRVNGVEVGTHDSDVQLPASGTVRVSLKAAAYLSPSVDLIPNDLAGDKPSWILATLKDPADFDSLFKVPGGLIRDRSYSERPYWHIERARTGNTREVAVEIVVDGRAVARNTILADGQVRELEFRIPINRSGWVAARILPSSHTNRIFVSVGGKPMLPLRASAEWCLDAVNQCWRQKAPKISVRELDDARKAYDHAREEYRKRIAESEH